MSTSTLRSSSLKRQASAEAFGTAAIASAIVPGASSPTRHLTTSSSSHNGGCLSPQQQQLLSNPPLVAVPWGHGSVAAAAEAWNQSVELQGRSGGSSRGSSAPGSPAATAMATSPAKAGISATATCGTPLQGSTKYIQRMSSGGGGGNRVALVADAFKVVSQNRSAAANGAGVGWGFGVGTGHSSPTSRLSQTDTSRRSSVTSGGANGVAMNGSSSSSSNAGNNTGNGGSGRSDKMGMSVKVEEEGSCYVTPIGSPLVSEGGAPPPAAGGQERQDW